MSHKFIILINFVDCFGSGGTKHLIEFLADLSKAIRLIILLGFVLERGFRISEEAKNIANGYLFILFFGLIKRF